MKSIVVLAVLSACWVFAAAGAGAERLNVAPAAAATTSFVSGHETIDALNDGHDPAHSDDKSRGAYGNWPQSGTQWVQYDWSLPVHVDRIDVYWFDDRRGVRLPTACRLLYWNGSAFAPVPNATGLGLKENAFSATAFDAVRTSKLRLEFDSNGKSSTGLLEWKVYDAGQSPNFPPTAIAGPDRVVVLPGRTYLHGAARDDGRVAPVKTRWVRESGPGRVSFDDPAANTTAAGFSRTGDHTLALIATDGELAATNRLQVRVDPPPPARRLEPVAVKPWRVDSPLWTARLKAAIVNWIPHCIRKLSDPKLPEGGIENFVQAGLKNAGKPAARAAGAPWSNAYTYNTVESMCLALMVDAAGDADLLKAQADIRATLEDWVPKIVAAQEPDGYLQTFYTLNGLKRWTNKADHEGYTAGYFIEAALAHYDLTGRTDDRLYRAALRLADCWVANIGPAPKKAWYDGHQALEMALVRLGRFVEEAEGPGRGRPYIALARFLLDSRGGGEEYDQSHAPVTRQYEAVGHAVRAVYNYAAMADIAMETGDTDYHSAVKSIWDNIVNKKYYITGGVGSGETSEGFGKDYSLPNHAYCESCSGCGEIFFQHRMNLAYHEARYADLLEETLYNAVLSDLDLDGQNFTYTNPLDESGARYKWHGCPCCVGNIPRTWLSLPAWTYAKDGDGVFVNLFVGGAVNVGRVAGVDLELVQATAYPWDGKVSITVNPSEKKKFAVRVRAPDRQTSRLYTATPEVRGLENLSVNGRSVKPDMENGYAVIERTWERGDRIDFVVPLRVQRVKADPRIAANVGRVALRYGPLVFNIESKDQDVEQILPATAPLEAVWNPGLLGGVMTINSAFANGSTMLAIPNFARNNRGGRSLVWIRDVSPKP